MKKDYYFKKILILIIILATIVRVVYVIKIPYTEKQHDVTPTNGGLSYILQIYENGKLPQNNYGQYYHPPLSFMLSALWLKIGSIFTTDTNLLYESLQFLTVIYSVGLIVIVYRILKELRINDELKLFVLLVMAFHPALIILSGSINNDNLCFTLMIWVILRLIMWYKRPNMKNTIIMAILTGLCVMTKTTGMIVAIPIIYIFLFKFYKEIRKSSSKIEVIKKYIIIFTSFGAISLPIGMWYSIRNYILFKQPILYVLEPKNTELYVGNYSFFERFIPYSKEIFNMYCNASTDYNIPVYLIKCSIFGEYHWKTSFQTLYYIAIFVNILIILITIICCISEIISKNKRNKIWKNAFFLFSFFNIISFILVNIKLPYGCTMDFRYMFSTIFTGTMFICFALDRVKRGKNKSLYRGMLLTINILTLILFVSSDMIVLNA